jgi:hypothetical protein
MTKPFHVVESARKWRERVSHDVAGLSRREKIAHFQRFESVDALKAVTLPTRAFPVVAPTQHKKSFNAVAESRKWKADAARKRSLPRAA